MKGIVLAGGKGSRLRPFTYSGAKQLVPVGNTPVLHFPVRQLVDAGVNEIALVVGDTEEQIRFAMGDGSSFGARFTYIRQDAPRGIAHALGICREFAGDQPVVLYLGDNVLLGGISEMLERFEHSAAAASVILREVPDPRAFGVAVVSEERLRRVIEKPSEPPSNLAVIGVYAFRPAVFDVIAMLKPSARGELEIADAINGLIDAGLTVNTEVTTEHWIDTGKMEDMLDANALILGTYVESIDSSAELTATELSGVVVVGAGAKVTGSRIRGPVVIGTGATIVNADIGPGVSIGHRCVVKESRLSNTILLEDAHIEGCAELRDSMVGRFARLESLPGPTRAVVGDHSSLRASR
jgi:glucose-1-phosphate thymidylyltransferase